MTISPRTAKALRIAAIVIIVAIGAVFLARLDWSEVSRALRHAELAPLLLCSCLYFVCLFGKALAWKIMLEPNYVVPMGRMYRYTIAAIAAAALTPARTGELVRVWALKRHEDVPIADATAVALAEKLLLTVALLIVVAPVPWMLPLLPEWVANTMLLAAGLMFGVLVGLFFAVRRLEAREPRSWLGRFVAGMHIVRDPKRLGLALVTLALTWTADLIAVMLVLHAVGIDIPVAGGMFILFTFSLAVAIPSTPAQVGALQVGALAATSLLGIPHGPALAFALLFQVMQIVPLLIVGFILELDVVHSPA